jgi:hypothetical protein
MQCQVYRHKRQRLSDIPQHCLLQIDQTNKRFIVRRSLGMASGGTYACIAVGDRRRMHGPWRMQWVFPYSHSQ